MAERSRARQTFADMTRSLGLVVVLVAVLLLIGPARTLIFPGNNRAAAVDYTDAATGFTRVVGAQAVVPTRLPTGWRANAATLTGTGSATRLHIGWATPGDHFAGLDETTAPPDSLVRDVLGRVGAVVHGSVQLGAVTWQLRRSARGETALTSSFGAVNVVVTGDADDAQLRQLASSLR